MDISDQHKANSFIKLFIEAFRRHKCLFFSWMGCLSLGSMNFVLFPFAISASVAFFTQTPFALITQYDIIYYCSIFVLSFFVPFACRRSAQYFETKLIPKLQRDYVNQYITLFIENDIVTLQTTNTNNVIGNIEKILFEILSLIQIDLYIIIPSILLIITSIISMSFISISASICFFVYVASQVILYYTRLQAIKNILNYSLQKNQSFMGFVGDVLNNIVTIKLTNKVHNEIHLINENFDYRMNAFKQENMFVLYNNIIAGTILGFFAFLFAYIASNATAQGAISVSQLSFLLTSFTGLSGWVWYVAERFVGSCVRVMNLENIFVASGFSQKTIGRALAEEHQYENNSQKPLIQSGAINFSDIDFAHENTAQKLFNNLCLQIRHGEKIALVGTSGSGKTTLVKLMLRFYDIQSGEISIDNKNIEKISRADLYNGITYVSQDPTLFKRSLLENITYGIYPKPSLEEVYDATQKAMLHTFIMNQPLQYETILGVDEGIQLSGGQKQRLVVARALLNHNAPIVVFDESSSQLDFVTESIIINAIFKHTSDKTCIFIAHRLSSIVNFDRIIVMKEGKIVGDGTHKELLKNNEEYKILWNAQKNDH